MQWEDWKEKDGSKIVAGGKASTLAVKFAPSTTAQLLDIGSGNGLFIQAISSSSLSITAADLDNFLSPEAGKRSSAFVKLNIDEAWPVANASVDMITMWNVLEHAENPAHVLREADRVLLPGGVFIFSMPNIFNLKNRLYFLRTGEMRRFRGTNSHIAILTATVLKKLYKKYFECLEVGYAAVDRVWGGGVVQKILPENRLFGHTIYYVLKKKP